MKRAIKSTVIFAVLGCIVPGLGSVSARAADAPDFLFQSTPVRLDPFAESPLQLNPPTFRWPAENEVGSVYRLELSRDPDFKNARTERVHDLFFRPLEPLEPGQWYWRVKREDKGTGSWIGTESFVIEDKLPRWPMAPWGEWLERIPATHPHTYITVAEVPVLRARSTGLQKELAPWLKETKEALGADFSLESWVAKVPPGADPFAEDSPARKQLRWATKSAASTASRPALDGAWLWLVTQDPWLLEHVKARALLIATFDPEGFISERNTGHDLGNIDFGNSTLVHDLGVIYDLLYDEFSPEERGRLRAAIAARAAPIFAKMRRSPLELMRAHAWQHGFVDGLVGALAIYRDEPRAKAWVELALKSFVAFYPWYGGDDGGSQEGPRYFHGAAMLASLNTLDIFRSAFGLRLEEWNPWFRNNPYFLLYSYPPGGLQAQLGDSNPGHYDEGDDRRTPGGKARLAALRMAELYGNGYMATYASSLPENRKNYSVSEYLRWSGPVHTAPQPLEDLPDARLFADVGTVFTHSNLARPEESVRFLFHASPYGGQGHAHADQNSFHIIAYNEHLLLDSGYYTPTGDPHREEWSVRTMAHNTILVDGTGQPWGGTEGYAKIAHFEQNDAWVYFVGQAATAYREAPLERFDRHVVWLKGTEVQTYVIVDDLMAAGGKARRFDWLLHAAQKMQVDPTKQTVFVTGEKGEARVQFFAPQELEFHQDDQFTKPAIYWRRGQNFPLPNQWHLKATAKPSAKMKFVTVIQVTKRGVSKPEVRASDTGIETSGWRVRLPVGESRLVIEKLP